MQERARVEWLVRAERAGRWLEDAFIVVLVSGLILLASAQIILRNFFSLGFTWADGIVRLAVLWIALVGAIAAERDRKHIAIDVLAKALPGGLQHAVKILTNAFAAVVTGVLAFYSWAFVADSRAFGDVLLDGWPAWVFQLILPVGFALLCYRYSVRTLRQLAGRD